MLASTDEHWHAASTQAHWNESFYFNAFDAKSRLGCAVRVGLTPSTARRDGFVCLYLPDQSSGFIRADEPAGDESPIAAGGIELDCVEPLARWHIAYDGPIHHYPYARAACGGDILCTLDSDAPTKHLVLDLEVEALSAAVDYEQRSVRLRPIRELLRFGKRGGVLRAIRRTLRGLAALPAMMRAHHYEQSMTVRGTVRVDGKPTAFSGHGQRDHSWGVRDMGVPAGWRWVSCQFGEDLSFNATEVDVLGLRVQSGFVHGGGQTEPLECWGYRARYDTNPHWPDSMDLWLKTKSGRHVALEANVYTPLPVIADPDSRDVLVTAARARYLWEGRRADGMVEVMERLA